MAPQIDNLGLKQRHQTDDISTKDVAEEKIHPPIIIPPEKNFIQKLFTHKEEEQFLHVHKILGITALVSFLYRLSHLGQADGNFGPNFATVFFLVHHFLLNASSFIFKLPQKRIQGGYRIWPEYRLHALVFASRSLAFIALRAYEQYHGIYDYLSPDCLWHMDIIVVLMTCALADLASNSQGSNASNTVRGVTFSDPYEQWFASEMQIYLTSFCLIGYRRYSTHLMSLFTIQCNAFLMTLRRKNAASQYFLTGIYSIMLLGAVLVVLADDLFSHRVGVGAVFGQMAIILRMGFGLNKYLLWAGLGALWWYLRTTQIVSSYNSMFWVYAFFATRAIAGFLGWSKRSKAPPEQKSKLIGNLVVGAYIGIYSYIFIKNYVVPLYDESHGPPPQHGPPPLPAPGS